MTDGGENLSHTVVVPHRANAKLRVLQYEHSGSRKVASNGYSILIYNDGVWVSSRMLSWTIHKLSACHVPCVTTAQTSSRRGHIRFLSATTAVLAFIRYA